MKDLQSEEIWGAVDIYKLRSIEPSPRTIAECSTDRKKYLQIDVSMGMRAMRAIVCDVLLARLAPLPSPQFSRID